MLNTGPRQSKLLVKVHWLLALTQVGSPFIVITRWLPLGGCFTVLWTQGQQWSRHRGGKNQGNSCEVPSTGHDIINSLTINVGHCYFKFGISFIHQTCARYILWVRPFAGFQWRTEASNIWSLPSKHSWSLGRQPWKLAIMMHLINLQQRTYYVSSTGWSTFSCRISLNSFHSPLRWMLLSLLYTEEVCAQ